MASILARTQQPTERVPWGTVVDASGVCIRGSTVSIVDGPGTGNHSGQPDECNAWGYDGFEFRNLPLDATVTLRATAPGYRSQNRQVVAGNGGAPVEFDLTPQ
jgi:carboxypeptidase family protein